jgi:O-methyltransferase
MSAATFESYADQHYLNESPALNALRMYAQAHEYHHKMTPPIQTQFIQSLCRLMRAERVIEVGAFVGYTTLAMAEAMPTHGQMIACERNAKWLDIGRPFWAQAGVEHQIESRIGDARLTLEALVQQGYRHTIDVIYIDADKQHYHHYLELGLQLIQSGGVLLFDNTLRVHHGDVLTPSTPTTMVLDQFNQYLNQRTDLRATLLPMYDGLVLVHR